MCVFSFLGANRKRHVNESKIYLGAAQNLWVFGEPVLFFHQYPENSLTKRTPGRARSRPKPPSLRRCTRSRTGPGPRRGPATPSSPTWGNGPGAVASARVRVRRRVTERLAARRADAACPEMWVLAGDARCAQSRASVRGSESHVVPPHGAACSVQNMGVRDSAGAECTVEDGS